MNILGIHSKSISATTDNKVYSKIEASEIKKMEPDKLEVNSNTIPINQYFFEDGIDQEKINELDAAFHTKVHPGNMSGGSFALYDISKYQNEFPYKLANNEILSSVSKGSNYNYFDMWIQPDSKVDPTRIRVSLTDNVKAIEMLDEVTFKNTVLKTMIIAAEILKLDEEMGHKLPDATQLDAHYSKLTKTSDFQEMKNSLSERYDIFINKNYSPEFIKKLGGRFNLDIDPNTVKSARTKMFKIIDEIVNDILDIAPRSKIALNKVDLKY